MGTLTYLELQDEVRSGLGGRTDLDSRLGRFINLAQHRLARLHDFDEMEIISVTQVLNTGDDGDRFLQLPNVREVYSIVLLYGGQSRKLINRTARSLDAVIPKPEYWARNIPSYYNVWGVNIEMWPLPLQTFDIRMRWTQWPLDLSADTDTSQFNQKDDVLIELAIARAMYSLGKEEDARKHEAIAKEILGEAALQDRTHPDLEIVPSASSSEMNVAGGGGAPWLDPFVRSTN